MTTMQAQSSSIFAGQQARRSGAALLASGLALNKCYWHAPQQANWGQTPLVCGWRLAVRSWRLGSDPNCLQLLLRHQYANMPIDKATAAAAKSAPPPDVMGAIVEYWSAKPKSNEPPPVDQYQYKLRDMPNGDYIKPQIKAFQDAGINNLYTDMINSASVKAKSIVPKKIERLTGEIGQFVEDVRKNAEGLADYAGTFIDATRAGTSLRYEDDSDYWSIAKSMDKPSNQFNLIGYSYGSLLAAQTAWYYAKKGNVVDHLVLLGSPISESFLAKLQAHKNIKKVIVINLKEHGDLIYAGMPETELITSAFTLGQQFSSGKGEGHFYYAHVVKDSPRRWKELAERLFNAGLR
jgi:hypothetical protein